MNHYPPPHPDNIKATLIEWERIAYIRNETQLATLCDGALQQILLLEEVVNKQDSAINSAMEALQNVAVD